MTDASSVGIASTSARSPCLVAFWREMALPSSVFGPWLFWPLRRLISLRCSVVSVMAVLGGAGCLGA